MQGHRNKNPGSEGDLLVSLSYSPLSCKLEGIIHKATGLRKYDRFGLSGMNNAYKSIAVRDLYVSVAL